MKLHIDNRRAGLLKPLKICYDRVHYPVRSLLKEKAHIIE